MHRVSEFTYLHKKDLSIFKLKNPVVFSDTIQPVRLPTIGQANASFRDAMAYIAGFAEVPSLNYITVRVQKVKWGSIQAVGYFNPESQTRPGDSGTPVVVYENGIPTQISVHWGRSGGTAYSTVVGLELGWINDVTGIPLRKYTAQ